MKSVWLGRLFAFGMWKSCDAELAPGIGGQVGMAASRSLILLEHATRRFWIRGLAVGLSVALALTVLAATAWAGNDSYTYTFNSADQLTAVGWQYGQIATFTYDGDNLRIRKTAPDSSETIYIRDADGNVIAEYDQDGDLIAEYVFVNGRRVCKINPDGTSRYYHADQVGTPQLITDDAGQVVWRGDTYPFGNEHSSEGEADPHRLTGKELDEELGLYYFNARYYDSEIGRFISVDPVAGKNEDPQSWNRYSYALNGPFRFLDPDGREVFLAVRPVTDTMSAGGHTFFVFVPTGGNRELFAGLMNGRDRFTLAGHKVGKLLRLLWNEPSDMASALGPTDDQNQRFLLRPPGAMSMEEFELAMFRALTSYKGDLKYSALRPDPRKGTANCNSLSRGALDATAAGGVPERRELEGYTPGWDDPIDLTVRQTQEGLITSGKKPRLVEPNAWKQP